MKLSQWCKLQGVSLRTGYNWFHAGQIPNAKQLPSGTILVDEQQTNNEKERIFVYARVSSNKQKEDLKRQIQRLEKYCAIKNYKITKIYKEIASGMNGKRRELWNMLNHNPNIIIVEHKDRLTRFGFEYIEGLLKKQNCIIEVIHQELENESDLIKDLISIITSFCARLYGLRRGDAKSKKIQEVLSDNN